MVKTFSTGAVALIFCCSVVVFVYAAGDTAADKGAEKASQEVAGEAASTKAIDFSKPSDLLNSDMYLQLYQIARDGVVSNGPSILIALVTLVLGRWMAMWFAAIGRKAMVRGGVEATLVRFLGKLIYYTLFAAVIIAAADQLGIKTTSLLAIMGAAGLAIGLALKDSLANFASGVMLILFRPFNVGDVVIVAGVTGKVQQIDIFSTIILTPDNQRFIVPNSMITSDVITNVNAELTRRIDLVVGIGYDDDIRLAKTTLEELVRADDRVLDNPEPAIAVAELGASSVDLIVRPWVKTDDYWDVRFGLTEKIKRIFDEKGISFPYPQQDVHMYQQGTNQHIS